MKTIENKEEKVLDVNFTENETKSQLLLAESDLIAGLIDCAGYETGESEKRCIKIMRGGAVKFYFHVRPLSDMEYEKCKTRNTKYVRNKQFGMKIPEYTDSVGYRNSLIYTATIEEDKERFWDSKSVWNMLEKKGIQVLTGTDVVEAVLMAGEKDAVIAEIDKISRFDSNIEEVVKN